MEDKAKKYGHQETMYHLYSNNKISLEDPTTLKLQQYKLIIEKKESMKYSKMQKLPYSDSLRHINHWDLLLNQAKYLALDFHEERKWKKSISCIMTNKIAAKIKRKKSNKKIDDLYQECLCIYFSINLNSTVTDITLPNDNRNKNDQLNLFLKKNNNAEYLSNEFVKWKGSINELKGRLTKKFGEKNITKAEKFLKVLNLIENIISIQEDTVKRLNTTKVNEEEEMNIDKGPVNLSDFAIVFESCSNTLYQDHHICTEYAENSNLDYNKLNKEITMLIDEITNEINEATNDAMIISNDQLTSFNPLSQNDQSTNDTTITSLQVRGNGVIRQDNTASNATTPNSNINSSQANIERYNNQISFHDSDDTILETLNPNKLFFSIQDFSLSTKDIKTYFEKLFKTEKFDILPRYNYKKMIGSSYDINSPEYDFENVFFKVFPPIYYTGNSFKHKTLLEKDIDSYQAKNKKKRSQKDIEVISNYDKITPLQKITFIWATSLYGTNPYIINMTNNIFDLSHNVKLGNEEINYIIEKILDEIGIDLFGSNLNLLTHSNYSQISNLIEPSIQIGATSNFNYTSQLSDYIKGKIPTLKTDKGIKDKYNLPHYSFGSVLRSPKELFAPLSFMNRNPLYRNNEKKMILYKDLRRQLIKYCEKIESLNNKNISKYDYYNMSRLEVNNNKPVSVTQISNKINSSLSYEMNNGDKNEKLNKDSLLKQFNKSTADMSIKDQTEKVLDNTQLKLLGIVNVISFYSKDEIESEWKAMRTSWYQNNTDFKPKQKKQQIQNTGGAFPQGIRPQYFPNQYHPNPITTTASSSSSSSGSTGHHSNYF